MAPRGITQSGAVEGSAYPAGRAHLATLAIDHHGVVTHVAGANLESLGLPSAPHERSITELGPTWSPTLERVKVRVERVGYASSLISRPKGPPLTLMCYPLDPSGGLVCLVFDAETTISALQANRLSDLGRWTRAFVHSLNNTLCGIIGYADIGLRSPKRDKEHRALTLIKDAATRVNEKARTLQSYARDIERVDTQEHSVLTQAIAQSLRLLTTSGHSTEGISCEHLPDSLAVHAAPHTLAQILANVIENALNAVDGDAAKVALEVHASETHVDIRIHDDGPGLTPALLERVFEPFVTLPNAAGKGATRVGLGLTLARSMAQEIGADLSLTSQPGHGCLVTLRCLRAPAAPSTLPGLAGS